MAKVGRVKGSRRTRPDRPYRKVPIRRLLIECNRRLAGARGPRAFELVAALVERWPQVQSGIVYLGDVKAGAMMKRCGRTAHRAKYDLVRVGLIRLHGAGPGLCPCSRCNGGQRDESKFAGGKIFNAGGERVSAATGYELDPSLIPPPSRPAPRPAGVTARRLSPAERRVLAEGQAKLSRALDAMRPRPGP
jgi:hypothetical protein